MAAKSETKPTLKKKGAPNEPLAATATATAEREGVSLEWWTLDDCITKKWKDNDKLHDKKLIASSIERYGFKDPIKFSTTLNGFEEGNGRVEVLTELRKRGPRDETQQWPPRGIRVGVADEWTVPVLVGVDAETIQEAVAYAVDHNNSVLAGGAFKLDDYLKLWGPNFKNILFDLQQNGFFTETIDSEDIDTLTAIAKAGIPVVSVRSTEAERGVTQEQEKQQFLSGQLRQMTVYFSAELYPKIVDLLEDYRVKHDLESHTDVWIHILNKEYEGQLNAISGSETPNNQSSISEVAATEG